MSVNPDDPRVRRTRQLLQNALTDLMGEMSFNQISVQDITTRAGVNRATFYAHFEDKYALVNYHVRHMFLEALQQRMPAKHEFSQATMRLFIVATAEFLRSFFGRCTPLDQLSYPQMAIQVQVVLYEMFLACQTQGHFPTATLSKSPETTATALSWLVFGATFDWAHGGLKTSVDELADGLLPYMTVGLHGAGV
ncbi:MAG: TetR/AcrR family transcriptional regulator [Chloroflexi bacterium]|nr:TetR/AcrR family transcriptional regulator [Chloroflexota bacterium]